MLSVRRGNNESFKKFEGRYAVQASRQAADGALVELQKLFVA